MSSGRMLTYCDGGAGSLKFPPIENPCTEVDVSGGVAGVSFVAALSIDDGGLRAGPDDCALADDAACCGAALGLANSGR